MSTREQYCPECGEPYVIDNFNGMYRCNNKDCPKEGCYRTREEV